MSGESKPVDALAVLLIASTYLTETEARYEARRIIDAVREESYWIGYHDGAEAIRVAHVTELCE